MPHTTAELERLARAADWAGVLACVVERLGADSGTLHIIEADNLLHLVASTGIPPGVVELVRLVPIGKGMAGLAVERRALVDACNIQTDTSGDVRPGARATGLQGSIVVPLMHGAEALGALGVANRAERTFSADEQQDLLDLGRRIAALIAAGPRSA